MTDSDLIQNSGNVAHGRSMQVERPRNRIGTVDSEGSDLLVSETWISSASGPSR